MKPLKNMAVTIVSATLIASTVFVPSAFAEGSEPLPYLLKDVMAATPEYLTDSALNNTYWVDVEKKEITDGFTGKTYYGVFPKYLTSPSKTAIADFPFNSLDGMTSTPNAGIVNSFNTYWFLPGMDFEERYGYLAGHDTAEGDTKPGQHPTNPIEKRVNPFGFGENDLLTQAEIKKPVDNLKVYGDLKLKDATDSKAVGELQPGDKLNLDFSVSIPWFKRYLNGWTLNYTRLGGMNDADVAKFHNSYGKVDAEFAFTLDIPDGVEVAKDASATISGIKGFSPSVTKTNDGKTLIVTLKKDNAATTQKWQDIINEVKNVDTSNIMISVTGLSVKKTVIEGKKYRIRGTVSGFYDFANSSTENFVKATTARENNCANRNYFFFAAEQDASGLDNNGEENKPKQISYSFQVKKADAKEERDREPRVLYRLYNPYTHEHFFTAETVENDNLVRLGWKSEGGVGYIYKHAEKGGVYRLYNPSTGEHHYTMNEDEVANCVKAGWKNEGVKWFSAQNKEVTLNKLYSMYNPYEKKFYHHYTADAKEIEQMVKAGWRKEEVKWCTLPVSYIIKK